MMFGIIGAAGLVMAGGFLLIMMKVFNPNEPDKETPLASAQQPLTETSRNNPAPLSNNPPPDPLDAPTSPTALDVIATTPPAQTTQKPSPQAQEENNPYDGLWEGKISDGTGISFFIKNNTMRNLCIFIRDDDSTEGELILLCHIPLTRGEFSTSQQVPPLRYGLPTTNYRITGRCESFTAASGTIKKWWGDDESRNRELTWTAKKSKDEAEPGAPPEDVPGATPQAQDSPDASTSTEENNAQPAADGAEEFAPYELTEEETAGYGNPNRYLANSIGWSIYDNETGKVCHDCPSGAAEAIRTAAEKLDFALQKDREQMVKEFVRIMGGPEHARKHPLVFYDGAGRAKYVWPRPATGKRKDE